MICGRPTAPWRDGDPMPAEALRHLLELQSCCLAAVEDGPAFCTCWEAVYEVTQAKPRPLEVGEYPVQPEMCDRCAYRPSSPERSGDERYQCSDVGELDRVALMSTFWCHEGLRRPVAWVHPSGVRIEAETEGYTPPIIDGIPYQADGTPALRCAGWAARAAQLGRTVSR